MPYETGFVDAPTYWTNYMMGQHNRAASGQAYYLVENVDLRNRRKLLDLGGGAASLQHRLMWRQSPAKSRGARPKGAPRHRQEPGGRHNLQSRISLLEGDFFNTEAGADYDVVLISGVVLIKSGEESRRLFRLAYDLLLPGGMIIIQDYMRIDESAERERLDTFEDMYVLVAFDPGAGDREGKEVASWLEDSGFKNTKTIPLPTQLALVTAEKPSEP